MVRKFQSTAHASSWDNFDELLMLRSLTAIFAKILFTSLFWLIGSETWDQTEDYLEKEGGPAHAELARNLLPYAATAVKVLYIGKIFFFVVCFKWPQMIKLGIYYELLVEWIVACMPVNINASKDIQLSLLGTI